MREASISQWVLLVLVGCASSQPAQPSRPQSVTAETSQAVPPEKVDEIHAILSHKSVDLEHCWKEEVMRTGNAKFAVDLTLKLTVDPSGKPTALSVPEHTGGSQAFTDCIIEVAGRFQFPEIPQSLELTWPYSFKPLY